MYTCIDTTMQIVLERGSIDARVLSTGGGGQGGSFPPKHFHKIGKTLLSNSHTLAIMLLIFYQQLIRFKVQNCVIG